MEKSKWVSFCGWACVAGVLLHVGAMSIDYRYRPGPYPVPQSVLAPVLLLMFPLFGLWLIGTIRHRVRVATAKVNAAAMVEAFGKTGAPALPALPTWGKRPPAPPFVVVCSMCKRPGPVARCITHGLEFCSDCWQIHERTVHGSGAGAPAAAGR